MATRIEHFIGNDWSFGISVSELIIRKVRHFPIFLAAGAPAALCSGFLNCRTKVVPSTFTPCRDMRRWEET